MDPVGVDNGAHWETFIICSQVCYVHLMCNLVHNDDCMDCNCIFGYLKGINWVFAFLYISVIKNSSNAFWCPEFHKPLQPAQKFLYVHNNKYKQFGKVFCLEDENNHWWLYLIFIRTISLRMIGNNGNLTSLCSWRACSHENGTRGLVAWLSFILDFLFDIAFVSQAYWLEDHIIYINYGDARFISRIGIPFVFLLLILF